MLITNSMATVGVPSLVRLMTTDGPTGEVVHSHLQISKAKALYVLLDDNDHSKRKIINFPEREALLMSPYDFKSTWSDGVIKQRSFVAWMEATKAYGNTAGDASMIDDAHLRFLLQRSEALCLFEGRPSVACTNDLRDVLAAQNRVLVLHVEPGSGDGWLRACAALLGNVERIKKRLCYGVSQSRSNDLHSMLEGFGIFLDEEGRTHAV